MSKKKTLLEEGTVRRFMKLANMEAVGTGFVNEMYAADEELEEGGYRSYKDDEDGPMEEEMMPPMQDDEMEEEMPEDEEMEVDDLEIEDEGEESEEEVDMDAGDMGELTLSDEEAQVFLKVADKVRAAMDAAAPAEELPAPDMGMGDEEDMSVEMDAEMEEPVEPADAEEEMEEEPMMDDMVNEVARRVARRLNEMKKSK